MNLRTPIIKLTAWYLLIIMCISLFFSIALYQLITNQVQESLQRQAQIFRSQHSPWISQFDPTDEELLVAQYNAIKERVRLTLVMVNGIILIIAGSISYLLAKRTLRPIEESLTAQRRFSADASHELRTPLTAMRAEIEVALREAQATREDYARVMRSTLEEIQRLERLSGGLLRLAQYEEQRQPAPQQPTSLAACIADACKKFSAAAQSKKITIGKPETAGTVFGDHESIVELFGILLDNAIKYSPARSTIAITASEAGRWVTATVTDHGAGIKQSDLPHVFDRFYRADRSRSKERVDGYGLGLPIAKQIVERHHGEIEVQSTPGQGTSVTVTLPRA